MREVRMDMDRAAEIAIAGQGSKVKTLGLESFPGRLYLFPVAVRVAGGEQPRQEYKYDCNCYMAGPVLGPLGNSRWVPAYPSSLRTPENLSLITALGHFRCGRGPLRDH